MNNPGTEFWVMVTSDKRKSGILIGLVVVLSVVSGRALLGAGPAEASATSTSASRRERMFSDASAMVDVEATGTLIPVQRPIMTDRNIFRLDPTIFPPPPQTDPSESLGQNSRSELADDPAETLRYEREVAEQEVRRQLAKLRLRSTVLGTRPLALIEVVSGRSGKKIWARPGDPVGSFTLVRVESQIVVLELDGVEFELVSDPSKR